MKLEYSVLAGVLLEPALFADLKSLTSAHFIDSKAKRVFEVMCQLDKQNISIDATTAGNQLGDKSKLFLNSIINRVDVVTPTAFKSWVRQLKDEHNYRLIERTAKELVNASQDKSQAPSDLIATMNQLINDITLTDNPALMRDITEVNAEVFSDYDDLRDSQGVMSGFGDLDKVLDGFQKQTLHVLAGRPGMGKTSVALNMASNMIKKGKRVVMFSLEMSTKQVANRIMAFRTGIDLQTLKTRTWNDGQIVDIENAKAQIKPQTLYVCDISDLSLDSVRNALKNLKTTITPDLVVIDHLGLLKTQRMDNRVAAVSELSWGLKRLAKDFDLPVLAISQLNRNVEGRKSKKPMLADLRDSGSIEQDADSVMGLYRDSYYNPTAPVDLTELLILKNRDGAIGTVNLSYSQNLQRYLSIDYSAEHHIEQPIIPL